mgnify:CR=1 FL=1
MAALNPFEIFGLKPQFRIDKQKLDEKYFEIQKKVHPDRFASASDAEKRVAQQWATLINDAYQKLSDPIQVLCALRGHPIDEDSSGSISEEFLFEQLERREAIADAKGAGDTAELEVMKKAIEKEKNELLNEVADAFDVKSDVSLAAEDLKKVMFLNRQLLDFE